MTWPVKWQVSELESYHWVAVKVEMLVTLSTCTTTAYGAVDAEVTAWPEPSGRDMLSVPSLFHHRAVVPETAKLLPAIMSCGPVPGPLESHPAARVAPGSEKRVVRGCRPVSASRAPVVSPPACMYPLAGVPPSALELAAVPFTPR